jgi:hypothetical protein
LRQLDADESGKARVSEAAEKLTNAGSTVEKRRPTTAEERRFSTVEQRRVGTVEERRFSAA